MDGFNDQAAQVAELRKLLAINEAAVADLIADGAAEEKISQVRDRCCRYGQCLNMMAGPMTEKKKRRSDAW